MHIPGDPGPHECSAEERDNNNNSNNHHVRLTTNPIHDIRLATDLTITAPASRTAEEGEAERLIEHMGRRL